MSKKNPNIKEFIQYLDHTLAMFQNHLSEEDFERTDSDVYKLFTTIFKMYGMMTDESGQQSIPQGKIGIMEKLNQIREETEKKEIVKKPVTKPKGVSIDTSANPNNTVMREYNRYAKKINTDEKSLVQQYGKHKRDDVINILHMDGTKARHVTTDDNDLFTSSNPNNIYTDIDTDDIDDRISRLKKSLKKRN